MLFFRYIEIDQIQYILYDLFSRKHTQNCSK